MTDSLASKKMRSFILFSRRFAGEGRVFDSAAGSRASFLARAHTTPSWALLILLTVSLAACSPFSGNFANEEDVESAAASLRNCARPDTGCSCAAGTEPIRCYELLGATGEPTCGVGTRYCRDEAWTACESITEVKVRNRSQRLAPGFTSCDLNDLGVAACNPDCFVAEDQPAPWDLDDDNSEPTVFRSTDYTVPSGVYLDGSGGPGSGDGSTLLDSDGDGIVDVAEEPGCENTAGNIDSSGRFGCPGGDGIGVYAVLNQGESASGVIPVFRPPPPPTDVYILADLAVVELSNPVHWAGIGPPTIRLAVDEPLNDIRANSTLFANNIEAPYVSRGFTPDVRYGFGYFHDYQAWAGFGDSRGDARAFRHLLTLTSGVANLSSTLNSLTPPTHERRGWGDMNDWTWDLDFSLIPWKFRLVFYGPESGSQALWSVSTGQGLPFGSAAVRTPNAPTCPSGMWGYPCFRDGALPVVAVLMDDPMHNGPGHPSLAGDLAYPLDYAPLHGRPAPSNAGNLTALDGNGAWSSPHVIPGNAATYWRRYSGDIAGRSNSIATEPCEYHGCGFLGTGSRRNWQGSDQTVQFDVTGGRSSISIRVQRTDGSGEMRVALYRKGTDSPISGHCTESTGTIDWRLDLDPGQYLVRMDASSDSSGCGLLKTGKHTHTYSYSIDIGSFDWRIGYNSHVLPEITDNGIKVVGMYGCSIGSIFDFYSCRSTCHDPEECGGDNKGVNQLIELAYETNARNSLGHPIYSIVNTGGGAANTLSRGIADLIADFEQEVVLIPRDNPSTGFDERLFVSGISVSGCPLGGACGPTAGNGYSCNRCRTHDPISANIGVFYDVAAGHPAPTTEPQIFDFTVDVVSRRVVAGRSGESVLRSIPVRIVIPPDIRLEEGAYWRDYDATLFDPTLPDDTPLCAIGGETGLRPDWLTFNWSAITPANSSGSSYIQFDVQSDDSKLGLGGAPGFCFRVPNLPGVPTGGCSVPRQPNSGAVAIAENLIDRGGSNFKHHLRVTATLHPTPDGAVGPTLYDMGVRYACTPFE